MSEQFLNSTSAHNRPFQCHDVLCALTLLVGRQEGHPACKKTERWGAGVVICLERGADLHMAQLMPLPLTVSCFSKIQLGFAFLVLAHQGSPGKEPLNRCVCVCVCVCCELYICAVSHLVGTVTHIVFPVRNVVALECKSMTFFSLHHFYPRCLSVSVSVTSWSSVEVAGRPELVLAWGLLLSTSPALCYMKKFRYLHKSGYFPLELFRKHQT